jgi:hypothetical protein
LAILAAKVTLVKLVALENADSGISVTDSGIVIEVIPEPENTNVPMVVNARGKLMDVSPAVPANA